jgi:hypothetical protein
MLIIQVVVVGSVITTRRILERVVVHYVTNQMAWKLLKGTWLDPNGLHSVSNES